MKVISTGAFVAGFQPLFILRPTLTDGAVCPLPGDFRSSRNGADLDTAVMEVLDLTEEQYVLHKQSILRRLERKRNKRSV